VSDTGQLTSAATPLRVSVGDLAGEPAWLAGTYFPPALDRPAAPVLVCLPGGTYNHRYFDLEVPGSSSYSFARDSSARGFPVVAFDMLGTGDSSRPSCDVGLNDQAKAVAAAVAQLPDLIGHSGPFVGVGHSMGGYVAMFQQANHDTYAALAILGTTNRHVAPLHLPDEVVAAAATSDGRSAMLKQNLAAFAEPYASGDRGLMRSWFHLVDVPDAVVDADAATTLTVVPRAAGAAALVPGIALDAAATIDVPVLLVYGEVDVSPAPHDEPSFFQNSPDVTLFLLARSGHCHNMASSRQVLWDRLARWCDSLT
jgi:pimeloyl-ACP methyl ester carboxylesterase